MGNEEKPDNTIDQTVYEEGYMALAMDERDRRLQHKDNREDERFTAYYAELEKHLSIFRERYLEWHHVECGRIEPNDTPGLPKLGYNSVDQGVRPSFLLWGHGVNIRFILRRPGHLAIVYWKAEDRDAYTYPIGEDGDEYTYPLSEELKITVQSAMPQYFTFSKRHIQDSTEQVDFECPTWNLYLAHLIVYCLDQIKKDRQARAAHDEVKIRALEKETRENKAFEKYTKAIWDLWIEYSEAEEEFFAQAKQWAEAQSKFFWEPTIVFRYQYGHDQFFFSTTSPDIINVQDRRKYQYAVQEEQNPNGPFSITTTGISTKGKTYTVWWSPSQQDSAMKEISLDVAPSTEYQHPFCTALHTDWSNILVNLPPGFDNFRLTNGEVRPVEARVQKCPYRTLGRFDEFLALHMHGGRAVEDVLRFAQYVAVKTKMRTDGGTELHELLSVCEDRTAFHNELKGYGVDPQNWALTACVKGDTIEK